jgi:hypothetical protein
MTTRCNIPENSDLQFLEILEALEKVYNVVIKCRHYLQAEVLVYAKLQVT